MQQIMVFFGGARFVLKDWSSAFDDPADYRKDVLSTPLTSTSILLYCLSHIQISSETNEHMSNYSILVNCIIFWQNIMRRKKIGVKR